MSLNYSILSYNKIEEIDEQKPISTPSSDSFEEDNEEEDNLKLYYSFYLPHKHKIEDNNLFANNNRSHSTPSLILITNINNNDTNNNKNNNKNNNSENSEENMNSIINLKSSNMKSNNLDDKKIITSYFNKDNVNSFNQNNRTNNINSIKTKKNSKKIKTSVDKSRSRSRNKIENSCKNTDSSISNITIKNEFTKQRIEYDNKSQNINVYINNNIFNVKVSNKEESINEINDKFLKNATIENKTKNYISKNNLKNPKKEEINKKKVVNNYISNAKPKNVNNYNNNMIYNKKKINDKKNKFIKDFSDIKRINSTNKKNIANINITNINNIPPPVQINRNNNPTKKLKNIDNNTFNNNFLTSTHNNNNNTNNNAITNININTNKLVSLKINQFKRISKKNGLFNLLTFLNSEDIKNIIETKNKKLLLLIKKSIFDAYYSNIKQYLLKYTEYFEVLKYNLIFSKIKDLLRIDITVSIRFIDKNNKITNNSPKYVQLIYLYEYFNPKKNNKNRLYDCYCFDLFCGKNEMEKNANKEFKGIYFSKQINFFGIDKNDELINIQPILPFKINDRGIFNLEIYSNNCFINPKKFSIKLKIKELNNHLKELKIKDINDVRINEYEYICKYWKNAKDINEKLNKKLKPNIIKNLKLVKNVLRKWFEPYFIIKDIYYDNVGLSIYKFHLIANECGVLINNNLSVRIIVKDNNNYIENEIKKNNLLFEKRGVFEIRKGENLIFYLAMTEMKF